ncbi:MAG TPA: hypothetical protein VG204_13075 [Terriglobia bacterium]|nr:hypothetical protein [Terriglobia bacterium]
MPLQPPTKTFLAFLQQNPTVRDRIRAAPGNTLLYAGAFFKPVWKEIADLKRTNAQLATKETLPDVLARITSPDKAFANLLAYVQDLERRVPWRPDGFTLWRALSGIFAANAVGAVSFCVASGVTKDKVFAATELGILARNPNVDALTKDVLAYYQRCLDNKQAAMNFGFISA